ncbi:unnamed protein product [Rhizoctonia solani]|uniref:F-box domain-containing protein n=1 Tax=Rhizoctonia solani TaxID=456999 RepID=A0A8H3DNP9_9AGAM|nr:unnamed protein product [Rhizoctonia solani]
MLSPLRWKETCIRLLPYIPYVNPKPSSSVTLPEDVLRLISQYYVESVLAQPKTVRQLRRRRKEYWSAIAPLAKASPQLWKIVCEIWRMIWATCCSVRCLSQCHGGRLSPVIRILTLGEDWEPETLNLTALTKLENLSIDYHKLLYYDQPSRQLRILPGVKSLPPSLRRLEILHFHGPAEDLFPLINSCPKLVELRLVQCTMFNNPKCMLWRVNAHNHYLVGHRRDDAINCANTLANHIQGLPHLERFHAHQYLTNLDSVYQHRLEHKRHHPPGHRDRTDPVDGVTMHNILQLAALAPQDAPPINPALPRLADKKLWAVSCPQCQRELEEPIEAAERLVASLLSAKHKSLKAVSFPSFLSPGRTAPSEWMVEHEYVQDRLVIWTQRPTCGRPRQRYRCEFVRHGSQWLLGQ